MQPPIKNDLITRNPHLVARVVLLLLAALLLRYGLALSTRLTVAIMVIMLATSGLISGLVDRQRASADDRQDERYRTLRSLLIMLSTLISLSLLRLILH